MPSFLRMHLALPALLALLGLCLALPLQAASFGTASAAHTTSAGNLYAGGADLTITTPVTGDLVAAGGRISLEAPVGGDAALAGGSVDVRAPIAQDLRVTGGTVHIGANIGGEVSAAAGTLTLRPNTRIGGDAMLSGNTIVMNGDIVGNATIYGRSVALGGTLHGNVRIEAQDIQLGPDARILGNLVYASPEPLPAASLAQIGGVVVHAPPAARSGWSSPGISAGWLVSLFSPFFVFGMLIAGLLVLLLFPKASAGARDALARHPVRSLLAGLALLFATPPVAVLFMATIIGIPIGFSLLALYPLLLLFGYLCVAFFVSHRASSTRSRGSDVGRQAPSFGWQALFLLLALILLQIVWLLPVIGVVVIFLATVMGCGAWGVWLYERYSARKAPAESAALEG